jgi:hypothetical protein
MVADELGWKAFQSSGEHYSLLAIISCICSIGRRAKEEASARAKAERKVEIYAITAAITMSLVLVGLFQSLIYLLKWVHPHGLGLQLAFDALLILSTFGFFHPKLRKWCWGAGAFAILLLILQLLG